MRFAKTQILVTKSEQNAKRVLSILLDLEAGEIGAVFNFNQYS